MATITVLDSAGATQTIEAPNANGQATMVNSKPVVIASNQSAIPVTATFYQATQPVSGTVGISGTVPVSGTFWQATQPVSGAFYQATQPVSIAATVAVTQTPSTGTARLISSAASDNATNVTAVATTVRGMQGYNARSSAVYLKTYDKATAPTSSDTPRKTLYIPAGASFALDYPDGNKYTSGFGYRLTTGGPDNDTGAIAAGDILGFNVDYI